MSMPTTSDTARKALVVHRIGEAAARFLETHRSAQVVAVFERSLYLEARRDFLCVGTGIGNGPLNAVIDDAGSEWLRHVVVGDRARIAEGALTAGGVRLAYSSARRWRPPPWPGPADHAELASALDEIAACAARDAPHEGLARLTLTFRTKDDATSRIAQPRIAALQDWLERFTRRLDQAQRDPTGRSQPPVALLGLGPGLTPSGDDLLCGALIALHAVGAHAAATELATAVHAEAPRATTPLSAAFLVAAGQGQGSEALHAFIAAAISGKGSAMPAAMAELGRIGHTSGWDALAGAVLVLRATARAHRRLRSP